MQNSSLPASCQSPGMDWWASLPWAGSFLSGSGPFSSCRIPGHHLTARPTRPSSCSALCPGGGAQLVVFDVHKDFFGEISPVCSQDHGQQHKPVWEEHVILILFSFFDEQGSVSDKEEKHCSWEVKEVWPCGSKVWARKRLLPHKKFHRERKVASCCCQFALWSWRFYCVSRHVSCVTSASRPADNKQELRL